MIVFFLNFGKNYNLNTIFLPIMRLIRFCKGVMLCGVALFGISASGNNPTPGFTATLADVDSHEAGGNYYCYPWLNQEPPAQTPAPQGYRPFHIEHSGRHGSRWHIGYGNYDKSVALLEKGERNGKLTPLGVKTLEAARKIQAAARGREGELSDNGALQHQGIGRRMARNYPQIFNATTNVNAKSTVVIRSILSMFNGLSGIQSVVPSINIKTDASHGDMWYMNYDDKEAWKSRENADTTVCREFLAHHENHGEYLKKLFNDEKFAKDSIGDALFNPLYNLLVNTQSHSDQPWLVDEIFSIDEIRERWQQRNINWFMHAGNSRLTGNRMPFSQANLLRDIIESTDSAINSTTPSANLRYSHDTIIFPLAVLMEMENFGEEINDLEQLAPNGWHDYLVVPMGANIQIVFYRKDGSHSIDDVLFKALLNEREVTLPFQAVEGPYYRWKDAKEYYTRKIAPYVTDKP